MKFFKSTFIFLSLVLCSLLSAQEAQFEVKLSNEINSNKIENSNIKARVEKFAEDFIQPIMRGDAYDIEITDIDLIVNYQKKNPIKCGFTGYYSNMKGKMNQAGQIGIGYCHDKSSYTYMYDDSELFDDEEGTIIAPFDSAIRQYELNKDRSVIISFQIKLKKEFQESLLKFLENETTGKDVLSYRNLPARDSAEGGKSEYIRCMGNEGGSHCTGTLGRQGDLMGISGNYSTISRLQEPNYVINFIDRRLEKVTFFNLKNYRSELVRSRKHRFLTNLCRNVNQLPDAIGVDYSFSRGYFNQNHTQFNDLSITINNKNGEAIDEILINLHQATDRFRTSGSGNQHTYGLRKKGDFIFSHNYGSNALKARQSDYLGTRNIMGHLIDENKKPYYRLNCNFPGLWAELPAFSIISNYEYHLVLQLDRDVLRDLSSAQIKYVSPQSSTELMDHHKD